MKKELTIEHLAAYLPYGVKVKTDDGPIEMIGIQYVHGLFVPQLNTDDYDLDLDNPIKICLRPLSQLTETIEHGGERFVPNERIGRSNTGMTVDPTLFPYYLIKYLHFLHFDTFGLIESGLAEPIPSIPQP
jgi:hypothetical protein